MGDHLRRHVATVGLLLAGLLLICAMSALGQQPPDTWPPSEMGQQSTAHGPMPVPLQPSPAQPTSAPRVDTAAAPEGADTTGDTFLAWVTALCKLGAAFGLGTGAGGLGYHFTCRRDQLTLGRGPMDFDALRAQLDRIEQRLEWIPAGSPPSSSPPLFKAPEPEPPKAPPRSDMPAPL